MKKIVFLVLSMTLSACTTLNQDQYYWGNYEGLVYKMYNKPGEADAATQVQLLTQDLAQASDSGKAVPPGFHVHLGYMYAIQGNVEQSQAAFKQEKALYPESATLVEHLDMTKQAGENNEK